MRQRPDGTLTYSTPEWDAKWYWPVGTPWTRTQGPAAFPVAVAEHVARVQRLNAIEAELVDLEAYPLRRRRSTETQVIACPWCGSPLQVIRDGMIARTMAPAFYIYGQQLRYAWQLRPFVACSTCEYCSEDIRRIE